MQLVTVEITNRCPLNCPACFVDKNDPRDIDLPTFKEFLKEIVGIEAITLTGGEPFVVPNLVDYCKACIEICNIKPSIFTSGFIGHDRILELKGLVKKIHVTFKFPNPLDDRWRCKGSFTSAERFLAACKEADIPTWINWAVDKTNFLFYTEMAVFAQVHHSKLLVLPLVCQEAEVKIPFETYCSVFSSLKKRQFPHIELGAECGDCQAGATRFGITAKGDVIPCIYLQPGYSVGNIFNEPFEPLLLKLWNWRENKGETRCIAQGYGSGDL